MAVTPDEIASLHADFVLAGLDVAVDALVDALKDMDRTGAWTARAEARTPAQEAAVAALENTRDDVVLYIGNLLHDRYGLLANVDLDPVSI